MLWRVACAVMLCYLIYHIYAPATCISAFYYEVKSVHLLESMLAWPQRASQKLLYCATVFSSIKQRDSIKLDEN